MEKLNPANRPGKGKEERKRIPMSVPVQKLEAPDIPGYHLHWFNGTPDRIQRAINGGYEFVDSSEVQPNSVGLGNDSTASGNTDLGSQVSVIGGSELGADNQPIRMILMKIKLEYYEEDQKILEARNDQIADALKGGRLGGEQAPDKGELNLRYVGSKSTPAPDLFTKGAMLRKAGRS